MATFRLAFLAFVLVQSMLWTAVAVYATGSIMQPQTADQVMRNSIAWTAPVSQSNCDTEFWCPGDYDRAVEQQAAENAGAWNSSSSSSSPCQFNEGSSVSQMLDGCKPNNVITADNYDFKTGAKDRIIEIANQIIIIGSLLSIGAIVYAGFLYVTSMGDDERIKTGKNSLKFGIIGFIVMLISFPLVNAIVRLFYEVGG